VEVSDVLRLGEPRSTDCPEIFFAMRKVCAGRLAASICVRGFGVVYGLPHPAFGNGGRFFNCANFQGDGGRFRFLVPVREFFIIKFEPYGAFTPLPLVLATVTFKRIAKIAGR
jgi:hypothetical protein